MVRWSSNLLSSSALIFAIGVGQAAFAPENTGASAVQGGPDTVVIIGNRLTTTATGLDLTLRETPQSVTVVGAEHIHECALQWNQSFYAPPRSVSVRLDYAF